MRFSGIRPWRVGLYAIITVVSILVLGELGLRLANYEGTTFEELKAAAALSPGIYLERRDRLLGDWYIEGTSSDGEPQMQANPALLSRGFHNEQFPREPGRTVRLFALGGSTTFGIPYTEYERGFSQRLERMLNKQDPQDKWRVINAGVAGMDSGSLPRMAREVLKLGAHGLILYTGINEMMGRMLDRCTNPYRLGMERQLNRFKLVRLLRSTIRATLNKSVKVLEQPLFNAKTQVQCAQELCDEILAGTVGGGATGDQGVGVKRAAGQKGRTDPHYRHVLATFRENLQEVADLARRQDAAVFLAIPAVNLLVPPGNPRPSPNLSKKDRKRLDHALARMDQVYASGKPGAMGVEAYKVLAIDPNYALTNHQLGMMELGAGRGRQARALLQDACDNDYVGSRPTRDMYQIIREICRDNEGVTCVDMQPRFNKMALHGVPGYGLFVDHCHPTLWPGVQLMAQAFYEAIDPPRFARKILGDSPRNGDEP